jgi:hypothetical protein
MEEVMRTTVLAFAAALTLIMGMSLAPQQAQAMPVTAGVAAAVGGNSIVQKAAYICRPIWRCGRYGCGWRQVCYWGPRRYWGRPYWRGRYWRGGRHWRRW